MCAHLRSLRSLFWAVPLLAHAGDALAWGLYTHVYFAQLMVWAVPLADARFRRALTRFPGLLLAATCLPDISLFSSALRSIPLERTHRWPSAAAVLGGAQTDEERAMALGYSTHLLTDIVAHNYFVPAHEAAWFRGGIATHAASEWAMDAHLDRELFAEPAALIAQNARSLSSFAQARLGFDGRIALKALSYLARAEGLLRRSRVPQLVYRTARRCDARIGARFDSYIAETADRLGQVNRLIAGETPAWAPEPAHIDHAAQSRYAALRSPYVALLPTDFFRDIEGK